ncbi:MAG: hypothetical protein IKP40_03555 [Clostridia bacterium]|nr:hypothetical protein [Clostridia bacterium]
MPGKESKTDRLMLALLCAAVAAGLLLCAGLYQRHMGLKQTLREVERQNEESIAAFQATDAAKLVLQDELKATREAIKEAELTLSESTEKVASIQAQLPALYAERDALQNWQQQSAQADPEALTANLSKLTGMLTVTTDALSLNISRGSAAGMAAGVSAVGEASLSAAKAEREALPPLIAWAKAAVPDTDPEAETARQSRISAWEARLEALKETETAE